MTTALENALNLEREKFAAVGVGRDLTPMEQGYYDALAKLGYAMQAPTEAPAGSFAARVKAAAGPALPPAFDKLKIPNVSPSSRPGPAKAGPLMAGKPLGQAPAAPALGGRKGFSPPARGAMKPPIGGR